MKELGQKKKNKHWEGKDKISEKKERESNQTNHATIGGSKKEVKELQTSSIPENEPKTRQQTNNRMSTSLRNAVKENPRKNKQTSPLITSYPPFTT